jgi:primosomal protein N' (replication factor Y) (superfamily II helicase)
MFVITVIPMHNIFGKEFLTYFSSENIPVGYIVTVPIRSKSINAIVIETKEAKELKADLKNADYELKKILKIRGPSPFSKSFFLACQKIKDYTIGNIGSIIKILLPTILIEQIDKLTYIPEIEIDTNFLLNHNIKDNKETAKSEKLIFQAITEDRLAFYRTLIREAFAKKESVFICLPTKFDIEQFKIELSKGIEQYVLVFHGEMSKKDLVDSYNRCISDNHPVLIIGTGIFLSISRTDLKTLIIEHESSGSYKQIRRPFVDIRTFAELLASIYKIKLIIGDTILRPETLYRHDIGELGEISSPLFRLPQVEYQNIIDMKNEENNNGRKSFNLLSTETLELINKSLTLGQSIFLFSVRKGLAPVTICQDCGNPLLCKHCQTPMVLYGSRQLMSTKSTQPRIFMCNKCGTKEKTETRCQNCSSWNLIPLGIGTDRIYEEIKSSFPKAKLIQIDKESITDKEARLAVNYFRKTPGSILIGTEMAFSYLYDKIDHGIIVSLDGLLSIPSFNITQKILHIIEKMQILSSKSFIIQTRLPDNQVLKFILSGNVLPLFREELNERKIYGYPPFKRLIKITFSGTKIESEKARIFINQLLGNYDPQIFSAFVGKIRGQYITNTIIKVDPKFWPLPSSDLSNTNNHLFDILRTLPPNYAINVDPEDLL